MLVLLWMFGKICLWSHLVQGFCVLEIFWILLQFYLLLLVYSGFMLLLDLVLEILFLEIYPFCSGFPISWHIIVHSNFLKSFVFLWYQLLHMLFHFWFYLFGSSLFFSWWFWLKFCQFCLSFQWTSSWILWSLNCCFSLYII